jgi:hypothetical protein
MKHSRWAWVVWAAVLLAPLHVRAAGPVVVQVSGGAVQLPNGTATFSAAAPSVTWRLGSSGYQFTAQSINFGGAAQAFSCAMARDALSITCTLRSGVRSAGGEYTVTVKANSGSAPAPSSPNVWTVSD